MSTAFREALTENSRGCSYTIDLPDNSAYDFHTYNTPSYFLENFGQWDNWEAHYNLTDVQLLLGEYSVFQLDNIPQYVNYSYVNPSPLHPQYPEMIHALGEGVYQLSAERNPDTVKLSAYAPSLQNRNYYVWTPNMISFEAQANKTVLSTSYWQQWLFAHFRGTQTVPVEGPLNPLYWVGSVDNSTGALYLKVSPLPWESSRTADSADHQHGQPDCPAHGRVHRQVVRLGQRDHAPVGRPQRLQLHLQPDSGRAPHDQHDQPPHTRRQPEQRHVFRWRIEHEHTINHQRQWARRHDGRGHRDRHKQLVGDKHAQALARR